MARKFFFFSEMGYNAYPTEALERYGYSALLFPNSLFDAKARDLWQMFLREHEYAYLPHRVETLHAQPNLASLAARRRHADTLGVGTRGCDHAARVRPALRARDPALSAGPHRELRSHARDGEAGEVREAGRESLGRLSGLQPPIPAARSSALEVSRADGPVCAAGTEKTVYSTLRMVGLLG
jgi:hypothetical protein